MDPGIEKSGDRNQRAGVSCARREEALLSSLNVRTLAYRVHIGYFDRRDELNQKIKAKIAAVQQVFFEAIAQGNRE